MARMNQKTSSPVLCDAALASKQRGIAAAKAVIAAAFAALAVAGALGLAAPHQAFAATMLDPVNSDAEHNAGITWSITSEGVLTVEFPSNYKLTGDEDLYTGDEELIIPSEMGGVQVTQVKGKSSRGSLKVTKLVYPSTLESWPTSLYSMVRFLTNLEEISFSGEVKCAPPDLKSTNTQAYFPASLKKFNANDSFDCVIPSSWTTLGGALFSGCQFTSLYIPATLESAASSTFSECTALTKVVNDSATWVSFPELPNITTFEVNGPVTEISARACAGWTNLEYFSVPSTVTSIGSNAFAGCTSLSSITFGGEELLTIGQSAFDGTAFTTFTVPDTVTYIGAGAFANTPIEAIVLSSELWQGYDMERFFGEPGHWGSSAVYNNVPLFVDSSTGTNDTLKSVDFSGYHQTYIPASMFLGCTGLEEIEIPRSVTALMDSSFEGCTNLKDVYYYGDPSNIDIPVSEWKSSTMDYQYLTAGAFGVLDGGEADAPDGSGTWPTYVPMDGITFYGLGIMENNELAAYADETNCLYVPYAFLGDGGSSDDVVSKFEHTVPSNEVSIASFVAGGTPAITVSYAGEDITRTLVPGEDCTVVYTDAAGNEVTSFDKAGAYTATITGDNKSVWGTTQVSFSVAAAPTVTIPVADGQNTGITAEGALVAEDGAEVVLDVAPVASGEAYDALVAAMGDGTLAGVYEATLLVNGQPVHDGFGTITLTFPIDPQWNGYYVTVWHRHADGTITSETVVAADSKVSVTVTDLSTFALEVGQKAQQDVVPPQNQQQNQQQNATQQVSAPGNGQTLATLASTGDELPVAPFAALAGAAACALGAAALARRKGRNAK